MKVILASKSPRRKELLDLIGLEYEAIESGIDEDIDEKLATEKVKKLSYLKAKEIFNKTQGDRIVVGADTIVEKDKKIYGKPKDRQEAIQMIQELQAGKNQVYTGISILVQKGDNYTEFIDYDCTNVTIKPMSYQEIIKWVDSGHAMDKAGAYAVQSEFCVFIESIDGNYTSVVGLPVEKLYDTIKQYFFD